MDKLIVCINQLSSVLQRSFLCQFRSCSRTICIFPPLAYYFGEYELKKLEQYRYENIILNAAYHTNNYSDFSNLLQYAQNKKLAITVRYDVSFNILSAIRDYNVRVIMVGKSSLQVPSSVISNLSQFWSDLGVYGVIADSDSNKYPIRKFVKMQCKLVEDYESGYEKDKFDNFMNNRYIDYILIDINNVKHKTLVTASDIMFKQLNKEINGKESCRH